MLIDTLFPHQAFDDLDNEQIKHAKSSAKQLIEKAVSEQLVPASVRLATEHDFVGHLTINILNKYNRSIIKYARQHKVSEAVSALGYLMAALNRDWHMPMAQVDESALAPYVSSLGYSSRREQNTFYHYLDDALNTNNIGVVEASTGVGKTLAMLAQANERALSEKTQCVISTNSLANLQQYIADYTSLDQKAHTLAPLSIIVGRQNYVSVHHLKLWLSSEDCPIDGEAIDGWLKRGGRNHDEPDFLPAYTLNSIKRCEPRIIDSEVSLTLNVDKEDLGALAYQQQFENAKIASSAIILVTHAMLCVDIRIRRLHHGMSEDVLEELNALRKKFDAQYNEYIDTTDADEKQRTLSDYTQLNDAYRELKMAHMEESASSLLPNYQYLFVDEAHLLESVMANIISQSFSLRAIIREANVSANQGLFPKSRLKDASEAIDELIEHQSITRNENIMLSSHTERENAILRRFCDLLLGGARRAKSSKPPEWLLHVRQLKVGLSRISKSNFTCVLTYSPVRQYPQVNTGEINTSTYLRDIWTRVRAAVAVSATLYIKRYNAYSCNYVAKLLAISLNRRAEYPPVVAPWTRNIVKTVYLPPNDRVASDSLIPVGRRFHAGPNERALAKSMWTETVANYLDDIYQSAIGGTMVLLTSYEDSLNLQEIFSQRHGEIPLVVASGSNTLDEQKAAYLAHIKAGVKPLWLTLGNAWVGLDVNGKSIGLKPDQIAEQDNVITDLVVVKIPFGTNMSLSHQIRMMKNNNRSSDVELMEAMMLFKQGLGRLVRLEHQSANRAIHILDGRLNHPQYKGYLSLIKALTDTYPHSVERTALPLK